MLKFFLTEVWWLFLYITSPLVNKIACLSVISGGGGVFFGKRNAGTIFFFIPYIVKLTWQGTLYCTWCTFARSDKKTVSFTVSWQKQIKLCVSSQKGELFKLSTFSFQSLMLKRTKKLKLWFAMFENTVKTVLHLLFTATRSSMNSPVNQTNRFFHGFLSDSVEITSCVYTKTIIHLRLS